MGAVTIETEADAVPIVRVMAARFRRTLSHPELGKEFEKAVRTTKGTFALSSNKDPQSVTISVKKGTVSLRRGVGKDAAIVIETDLDNDDANAKVRGLWRHPFLAMGAAKMLAPYAPPLEETLESFWEVASRYPHMPPSISFHSTDEKIGITVGGREPADTGSHSTTFHGTTKVLGSVFGGNAVLAEAMLKGELKGRCTTEVLARLSEITKDRLLGNVD